MLVLEFVDSNLRLVIDDIRRPQNFQLAKFYFAQALSGLAYLHHLGIMHRVGGVEMDIPLVTAPASSRM